MSARPEELLRHWPAMVGVCERILGNRDDAEDCASAALISLLEREGQTELQNEEAWLVAVAKRRAIDHIRSQARERRRTHRAASEHVPCVEDVAVRIVEDAEARWLAESARSGLPQQTQDVLQALMNGHTLSDTARSLRMTKRAAESHLHRARRLLRASAAGVASLCGWWVARLRRSFQLGPAGTCLAMASMALITALGAGPGHAQRAPGAQPLRLGQPLFEQLRSLSTDVPPASRRTRPDPGRAPLRSRSTSKTRPVARVGNNNLAVVVTRHERQGPSDPVGVVEDCLAHLEVTASHVGC